MVENEGLDDDTSLDEVLLMPVEQYGRSNTPTNMGNGNSAPDTSQVPTEPRKTKKHNQVNPLVTGH